jgi:hypothetical protein
MATTVILAAGQTAANSTTVTVASGGSATLSIYASAGAIPQNIGLPVYKIEPGPVDSLVTSLTRRDNKVQVTGPGDYYVKREDITAYGTNVGVSSAV